MRITGPNKKTGANKMELAEAVMADIQEFKKTNGCSRLVMIWCGSTEVFTRSRRSPDSGSVRRRPAQQRSRHRAQPDLCLRRAETRRALRQRRSQSDHRCARMLELARDNQVPICGKDFKTGQTYMKTLLAPGFKARMLGLSGWFSTNILGNRDGEVLEDPGSFKTKEETKLSVLQQILQPIFTLNSTRTSITRSASTTIHRAATPKKAGTTSIFLAGSVTRCRSKSTFFVEIRFWPLRWFWI